MWKLTNQTSSKLLSSETKKKEKKKKKTCFQVTRIELGWQYCNISHTMGPRLVTSLITTLPLLPPTVIFISHPNQLFSTYLGLHFPLFSSPKPTTTTPSHSRLAQALLIYLVDVKKKKKNPSFAVLVGSSHSISSGDDST